MRFDLYALQFYKSDLFELIKVFNVCNCKEGKIK